MRFAVAVNLNYRDKVKPGDHRFWDFNMTFQNRSLTLVELLAAIRAGYAWTAPHEHVRRNRPSRRNPDYQSTYRVKENVISSQLLALDSDTEDERSDFDVLLQDTFIGHYAALLHASASSTPQRPRSRVIFLLSAPLPPPEYEEALQALLARYPFCDQSVKHAAVVFYGARQCDYRLPGRILPLPVLQREIIEPYRRAQAEMRRRREAERQKRLTARGTTSTPSSEQVSRYISQVLANTFEELATTVPGTGERHLKLFRSACWLGSLQAAPWLTNEARQLLAHVEADLLEAAVANGYVADYGEDDAWRTIDNGLSTGGFKPAVEPVWYQERSFFDIGTPVEAVIGDRVAGRGRVSRFRSRDHWEFELDSAPNVWFAHNLLRKITP